MSTVNRVTCPACHVTLKSPKPVPVGTKTKCPRCGNPFTVTDTAAAPVTPPASLRPPSPVDPPAPLVKHSRPQGVSEQADAALRRTEQEEPVPVAELDDEEEQPVSKPTGATERLIARPPEGGSQVLVWVLGIGALLLVGSSFALTSLAMRNSLGKPPPSPRNQLPFSPPGSPFGNRGQQPKFP